MATSENAFKTETAKAIYAAINRNDIPAVLQLCNRELEIIEPGGFPTAGTYRGNDVVLFHISRRRGRWAEGA